jgi:hypothetical protein
VNYVARIGQANFLLVDLKLFDQRLRVKQMWDLLVCNLLEWHEYFLRLQRLLLYFVFFQFGYPGTAMRAGLFWWRFRLNSLVFVVRCCRASFRYQLFLQQLFDGGVLPGCLHFAHIDVDRNVGVLGHRPRIHPLSGTWRTRLGGRLVESESQR